MAHPEFRVTVGDCRAILPTWPSEGFDAIVTDPPYELGFMGKSWDKSGVAFDRKTWEAAARSLRPGGYMVAMGGTRTYHRLTCAIEDAGFEIRDCLMWLYGSGFPKGKGCLKPAWEPIVLARKPGPRVLPFGVDECRVPCEGGSPSLKHRELARRSNSAPTHPGMPDGSVRTSMVDRTSPERYMEHRRGEELGRYPANVVHDGSDEVLGAFAAFGGNKGSALKRDYPEQDGGGGRAAYGKFGSRTVTTFADSGTAARFYYCAKPSSSERAGNTHPTVKPVALMRWLVRLVCPPGGRLLDPFGGSGTTGVAAKMCGRPASLIELDPVHARTICRRIDAAAWETGEADWREPDFGSAESFLNLPMWK